MLVLVVVSLLPFTSILPRLRGGTNLTGDFSDLIVYVVKQAGQIVHDTADQQFL